MRALRRSTCAWPSAVRRSSRAATPSSVEAAWSVQAASSTTLRSATCGSSRRTTQYVANPVSGKRNGGGPPGEARDHPERTRGEQGAHGLPHAPAHQLADLPGVVVDAVEHLAHGLLGQLGERLGHRGVEQVGAQRALGAVAHRGPDRLGDGVDDGTADDAQRQQHDQRRGGVLGEPAGDHRPEGCRDGTQQGHREAHDRERTTDPAPVDGDPGRRHTPIPRGPVRRRAPRVVVPHPGDRHNP